MRTVDAVKGTSGEQGPLMHCGGCRRELVTQTSPQDSHIETVQH